MRPDQILQVLSIQIRPILHGSELRSASEILTIVSQYSTLPGFEDVAEQLTSTIKAGTHHVVVVVVVNLGAFTNAVNELIWFAGAVRIHLVAIYGEDDLHRTPLDDNKLEISGLK